MRTGVLLVLFLASVVPADVTPMDAPLKEGGTTEITVKCDGGSVPIGKYAFKPTPGEYHYNLWIPADYNRDQKELFPLLFVQSPGGNAAMGRLKNAVEKHRIVVVMLVEAKNGPWNPIVANFTAAHDDVIKRCRIAEGFKYMTGFSGGARSSTLCSELRPGFSGAFCQGAGAWPEYGQVPHSPYIGIFLAMGATDGNAKELPGLHKMLTNRGFYPLFFDGGHTHAPDDVVEQAFDWLDWWSYHGSPTNPAAKPMYIQRFNRLLASAEGAAGFEKYELLDKAEDLASRRQLAKDKQVAAKITPLKRQIAELARTAPVKKQLAARVAYQKIADAEYQARRQARGELGAHRRLMTEAANAYEGVAGKHAGTVYGDKAAAAARRCKGESALQGKPAK